MLRLIIVAVNSLIALCFLIYPFVLLFGQDFIGLQQLALIMASLWASRFFLAKRKNQRYLSIAMGLFFLMLAWMDSQEGMYWYPVLMSSLGLAVFVGGLFSKQNIIERIARLQEPDLDEEGVRYTRKISYLWIAYFVINIAITVYYILTENWQMWAYYTGIISYVIMGFLLLGEWLYRHWVLKR